MDCENCEELKTLRKIVAGVDKLKQYDGGMENYLLLNPKSCYCRNFTLDGYIKLEQENQALKERWQKLKEWIEKQYNDNLIESNDVESPFSAMEYYGGRADSCKFVLSKMQKIDKE